MVNAIVHDMLTCWGLCGGEEEEQTTADVAPGDQGEMLDGELASRGGSEAQSQGTPTGLRSTSDPQGRVGTASPARVHSGLRDLDTLQSFGASVPGARILESSAVHGLVARQSALRGENERIERSEVPEDAALPAASSKGSDRQLGDLVAARSWHTNEGNSFDGGLEAAHSPRAQDPLGELNAEVADEAEEVIRKYEETKPLRERISSYIENIPETLDFHQRIYLGEEVDEYFENLKEMTKSFDEIVIKYNLSELEVKDVLPDTPIYRLQAAYDSLYALVCPLEELKNFSILLDKMYSLSSARMIPEPFPIPPQFHRYLKARMAGEDPSPRLSIVGTGGYGSVYNCSLPTFPLVRKMTHLTYPRGMPYSARTLGAVARDALREIGTLFSLPGPKNEFCRPVIAEELRTRKQQLRTAIIFPKAQCDLVAYLDNAPLTKRKMLKIAFDITKQLHTLHTAPFRNEDGLIRGVGIVQSDLKPGNVFMFDEEESVPKLGDFGAAGVVGQPITSWTAIYAAPEVTRGKVRYLETSQDVWSLGVTIATMLTGSRVFNKDFVGSEKFEHQREVNARITRVYEHGGVKARLRSLDMDGAVRRIIQGCLVVRPEGRMTTGDILADPLFTRFRAEDHESTDEVAAHSIIARAPFVIDPRRIMAQAPASGAAGGGGGDDFGMAAGGGGGDVEMPKVWDINT